jgi:hypothetical protein
MYSALFILSLINLLENDLFTSIMLIFIGMIELTVNCNISKLRGFAISRGDKNENKKMWRNKKKFCYRNFG